MDASNEARLRVWKQQPSAFFDEAVIDADGTLVATDASCKEGVDLADNGVWGYPLWSSRWPTPKSRSSLPIRAATAPRKRWPRAFLSKRSPSVGAGFHSFLRRGDTDFTRTTHLDRWDDAEDIRFLFGIDAMPNLVALAWMPTDKKTPNGTPVALHGFSATTA